MHCVLVSLDLVLTPTPVYFTNLGKISKRFDGCIFHTHRKPDKKVLPDAIAANHFGLFDTWGRSAAPYGAVRFDGQSGGSGWAFWPSSCL